MASSEHGLAMRANDAAMASSSTVPDTAAGQRDPGNSIEAGGAAADGMQIMVPTGLVALVLELIESYNMESEQPDLPAVIASIATADDGSDAPMLPVDDGMPVFIRNLHGKTAMMLIRPVDAIVNIRKMVADTCDVESSGLRLIWQGKQLEDGLVVSDYEIKSESTIHTVMRLRGAGKDTPRKPRNHAGPYEKPAPRKPSKDDSDDDVAGDYTHQVFTAMMDGMKCIDDVGKQIKPIDAMRATVAQMVQDCKRDRMTFSTLLNKTKPKKLLALHTQLSRDTNAAWRVGEVAKIIYESEHDVLTSVATMVTNVKHSFESIIEYIVLAEVGVGARGTRNIMGLKAAVRRAVALKLGASKSKVSTSNDEELDHIIAQMSAANI